MPRLALLFVSFALVLAGCVDTARPLPGQSGITRANFDTAVRAQDDFYRHVNGRWNDTAVMPPDRQQIGAFTDARERAFDQLHALCENLLTDPGAARQAVPPASPNAVDDDEPPEARLARAYRQQVRDFYRSFMDETAVNAQGLKPVRAGLRQIDAIDSPAALQRFLGTAQPWLMRLPFSLHVAQDDRHSERYTLYARQSGLGLPDREYYLKDEGRYPAIRRAYEEYVRVLLDLAGHRAARREAAAVLALETELARLQWPITANQDPLRTYNPHAPAALRALTPGLDWDAVFAAARLPAGREVVVAQPSYFAGLDGLLRTVPLDTWRAYLAMRLLDSAAPYLNSAAVEASFAFRGRTLQGLEAMDPRWRRALQAMDFAVGEQLGKLYVEAHFDSAAKQHIEALVTNVRAAFLAGIDELAWMSPATRAEAKAKLARLHTKIGYPRVWRSYDALYIRPDDLYGNMNRAAGFDYNRMREKLDAPVDRDEWWLTPQTVNAYYDASMNEVVFTAAILQPPFFDPAADDAVNYGAIGAVIGHEVSHAFDNQGRKYDGAGNLRDWWQPADAAKFEALTDRLAAQYAQFEALPGVHVDGRRTLGENIADLSGVAVAWRAWRASLHGQPAAILDGSTGAQRFFYGWAQVWREKRREAFAHSRAATDPHSPPGIRVLGVLRNFTPFYEAFGVQPGDAMYLPPDERVRIW